MFRSEEVGVTIFMYTTLVLWTGQEEPLDIMHLN